MQKSREQVAKQPKARSKWIAPQVIRISAGDAELGPNNAAGDGPFSGS